MAETFEATRAGAGGFEQRVCLKRVLPAFSQDDELVVRFRREARLAAKLRHTHIVGVVDFGEIDGVPYMALELVDGVDLRSFLKASPGERLTPDTVALIGLDLAYALEHAHRILVHRDISPSNILLSRSGEAKLADFGIAKAIENATATASRSGRGKVPYMCPEHMRGERVDGRADLFSLGVVLFEAAAGARPFDGAHDVETMQRILEGERPRLGDLAPEVPPKLCDVIEHLIEVDVSRRTPSATALIEELAPVAPSPQVRRALGAAVESHRGGPEARLHVRARDAERDTELSGPPALETPGAPHTGKHARWRRSSLLLASSLSVAVAAAFLGAGWLTEGWQTRRGSSPAAVSETALPAASPGQGPAEPTATMQATAAPERTPTSAPQPPPRAGKGWLHVVVEPWGNVWIDDTWMGRAPVKARLTKGRHVVKVGRELPTTTRVVRVEAGTRKEVEIRLTD